MKKEKIWGIIFSVGILFLLNCLVTIFTFQNVVLIVLSIMIGRQIGKEIIKGPPID